MLGDAENFLLHRQPMLLVDSLLQCTNSKVCSDVILGAKHTLFLGDNNTIPGWISIELMAQTIGLWAGYHAQLSDKHSKPKLGFLLGGRQCQFKRDYKLNERLLICASIVMKDEQMANFKAEIFDNNNQIVAKGSITTYQPLDSEISSLLGTN